MTQKTVFVLGAGASADIHSNSPFSVGAGLAQQIETALDQELSDIRRMEAGPISRSLMGQIPGLTGAHELAMRRIRDGIVTKNSIDEFIDEWSEVPHLPEVGKLAIAQSILSAERNCLLYKGDLNADEARRSLREMKSSWIAQIIANAKRGVRRRDIAETFDSFSFITFNYDRTVEQYVYCYCLSALGMSSDNAMKIVAELDIHHVYGSLGAIGPTSSVSFGADDFSIGRAAREIKTFTEQIAADQFRYIRSVMDSTNKVVFLGFAFHPQNLRIIIPHTSAYEIWATVYRMRPAEINRIEEMFVNAGCKAELANTTCGALIEEFQDQIFD